MIYSDPQIDFIEKIIQEKTVEIYSNGGIFYFDCSIEANCLDCNYLMECEQLFDDDIPLLNHESAKILLTKYPEHFI